MKWILAILMLISITTFGQIGKGDDSTKYIRYQNQYGQRMPRSWWDSVAHMPYGDTATFPKPCRPGAIMMHTDKNFYKWNGGGWASMGSGGGSADSATFATNYRVDTAKANLRTQIAGKQATGNYITALTGDVTASGPGSSAATIANNAVTNAKAAQMAAHTFKGNNTGSTANASDLTATQLTAELNVFGAGAKGLVPAAGGSPSSTKYLSEDGTFSTPAGGGGSQTLQQTFDHGSLQTKHDTIYQGRYILATNGQFINKDTNRVGDIKMMLTFGVSTDYGYIPGGPNIISNWVEQVAGRLGLYNWNRASSATTLINHGGVVADSSMEAKLPIIPHWDPNIRYILIGNYTINEWGRFTTDTTTYRVALSAMIDSLHINRGYPLNTIILLNGYPAFSGDPGLQLLAIATIHVAIEKGVRYFDSYNYLSGADINVDNLHLSLQGQLNLATGMLNSTVFDSVNYISTNVVQVEKALTVHGKTYLGTYGIDNLGNDSTHGSQYIGGPLNLVGDVINATTFDKGITIKGDAVVDPQRWMMINKDAGGLKQRIGAGIGDYYGNGTFQIFDDGFNGTGVTLGKMDITDGVTFTPTFHSDNLITRVHTDFDVLGASTLRSTTINNGLIIKGDAVANDQRWLIYRADGGGLHLRWGMGMTVADGGALRLFTDAFTGRSIDFGRIDNSDSVTFTPILHLNQSSSRLYVDSFTIDSHVKLSSLSNQTDTTTYKPLVVNSTGDLYKMAGWPVVGMFTLDKFHTATGNSGTSETDLYSYTVAANKIGGNDQSINLDFSGLVNDITTTNQIRVYFAGVEIFNTGGVTITGTGAWSLKVLITRETSSTAIATVTFNIGNASVSSLVNIIDLTSLDFTSTNILKVTGTAGGTGASSNDITGKHGLLTFIP